MTPRPVLRRAALTTALWPLLDAAVHACPICFQTDNAHVAAGARAAVIVLVAVTTMVVGACALFFTRLVRADAPPTPSPERRLANAEPRTANVEPSEPRNLAVPDPRNLP
jgi:hypothetical protein